MEIKSAKKIKLEWTNKNSITPYDIVIGYPPKEDMLLIFQNKKWVSSVLGAIKFWAKNIYIKAK